jgi:hypothetical protein
MNQLNELIENKEIFFRFLSERLPVFTGANVFLRDIQYGIKFFFQKKDINLKYPQAEKLAIDFAAKLVETNDMTQLDRNTWKMNMVFREVFVTEEKTKEPA